MRRIVLLRIIRRVVELNLLATSLDGEHWSEIIRRVFKKKQLIRKERAGFPALWWRVFSAFWTVFTVLTIGYPSLRCSDCYDFSEVLEIFWKKALASYTTIYIKKFSLYLFYINKITLENLRHKYSVFESFIYSCKDNTNPAFPLPYKNSSFHLTAVYFKN